MLQDKQVAVIGAGIAGVSAADQLAGCGLRVVLIEKAPLAGGHAARFSCKAVEECVRCGACMIQDRLQRIGQRPNITMMTGTQLTAIRKGVPLSLHYAAAAESQSGKRAAVGELSVDALLLAVGFTPYDPMDKPYGHGRFPNVLTNLQAEEILRRHGRLLRPSDGRPPERVAFVQCVGSRDSRAGRNWCSKVCCGSALRMARLIQSRHTRSAVTFFYIDVQNFGRNFEKYYRECRERVQTVRAIPGDVFEEGEDSLRVTYFDPDTGKSVDQTFDLVILSVGWAPAADLAGLAGMAGLPASLPFGPRMPDPDVGLFMAGAALGPMSIAESIDSAQTAAAEIVRFLSGKEGADASRVTRG